MKKDQQQEFSIIHCVELFKQRGLTHGDACYVCFKAKEELERNNDSTE